MSTLVRLRHRRLAAGVCAGVARRIGVDAWLIRAAFVVAFFINPVAAILAYTGAWVLMPEQRPGEALPPAGRFDSATIAGAGLIVLGAAVLVDRLFPLLDDVLRSFAIPLALIVLGIVLLSQARQAQ